MKIIGHRGAKGLAPENTIAALQKGLALGVDMLEIDVRRTKDNIPVLIHDSTLERLANNHSHISHHSLAELRVIKPDLTTLDEAIKIVNRQVPLVIEVKTMGSVPLVVNILQKYLKSGWLASDFLLASFNKHILQSLHLALPEVEMVVNEKWSGLRAHWQARRVSTKRLSINQRWLWSGFIKMVSRRGYKLSAYPLNDPKKADRWARFGLYGAITDYPDRFKK